MSQKRSAAHCGTMLVLAGLAGGFFWQAAAGEPLRKGAASASESAPPVEGSASKDKGEAAVPKQLFSGKVVLLPEALKRRGIKSNAEMKDQVVLETDSGELIPLVSDWRGRAFFQDERLRNRRVDLVGTRRPGVPYLQVLMVFTFDEQGVRQYTDYWCDICSIPMYEIKPCDCCQADIRLRFQPRELPGYVKPPGDRGKKTEPSSER